MLEYYADVIAIRHFQQGAPAEAAKWASVPVIQLRRRLGRASHPGPDRPLTTILLEKGNARRPTYLLVGDMRMRTMHSILYALSQSTPRRSSSARRTCRCCPSSGRARRAQRGLRRGRDVRDVINEADIIYMEPVVQADYTASRQERTDQTGLTPPEYVVSRQLLREKAKRQLDHLHSLPRMDELPADVDATTPPALLGRGFQRGRAQDVASLPHPRRAE